MTVSSLQRAAEKQARTIENYWASRGHLDVRCVVVVSTDERGQPVYGVRSNIDPSLVGALSSSTKRR